MIKDKSKSWRQNVIHANIVLENNRFNYEITSFFHHKFLNFNFKRQFKEEKWHTQIYTSSSSLNKTYIQTHLTPRWIPLKQNNLYKQLSSWTLQEQRSQAETHYFSNTFTSRNTIKKYIQTLLRRKRIRKKNTLFANYGTQTRILTAGELW